MRKAGLCAAGSGHTAIVKALLDGGARASIEQTDRDGESALMPAARGESGMRAAEMLLAAGANAKLVNHDGESALALAAERGHPENARLPCERRQRPPLQ